MSDSFVEREDIPGVAKWLKEGEEGEEPGEKKPEDRSTGYEQLKESILEKLVEKYEGKVPDEFFEKIIGFVEENPDMGDPSVYLKAINKSM